MQQISEGSGSSPRMNVNLLGKRFSCLLRYGFGVFVGHFQFTTVPLQGLSEQGGIRYPSLSPEEFIIFNCGYKSDFVFLLQKQGNEIIRIKHLSSQKIFDQKKVEVGQYHVPL